jgi:hypothetical protein
MATFSLDRKRAIAFLSSFGEDTEDLLVKVDPWTLKGMVAFDTFFFRKEIAIGEGHVTAGDMGISDLKKVIQFCKKGNNDTVKFTQQEMGKQLTVKCGGMNLKVPTMASINSYAKVPSAVKVYGQTEQSMFTMLQGRKIEGHGEIDIGNLKSVSGFQNFFTYPDFKISIHAHEEEFFIKAGKQGTMQLTIDTELDNAKGPNLRLESKFGKWLIPCTSLLSAGTAEVHMGEATSIFLVQNEGRDLLVIKNEA